MRTIKRLILLFTIIGGLNWGLIAFCRFNLVSTLFGTNTPMERMIYRIVGICSFLSLRLVYRSSKKCSA
ncbi:DUF378 domain-containing protein [Priestia taiwanensis]|uniref:DUF378 domain-containing protein n=1 Tax=Priestia taiwanensis TaxID=1347902 RepID=A0A917AY72_9BACI|nr:DUF378 domain-containing protein [Priestia taiwanensis]MBM7364612.1 uncharacterized membrane protein YuzA (DUF378 family) [Priestia taiwanensis]GGE80145.1 DUF378 domain-containing protein [Priestia taiwanensis]